MKKDITILDVISYYNIIGLSVGIAIGMAGKDLILSLIQNIIMPMFTSFPKRKFPELNVKEFISHLIVFILTLLIVLFLLILVLKPIVVKDIEKKNKDEDN